MKLYDAFYIPPAPCTGCERAGNCDRFCSGYRMWFRKHWAKVCSGLRELDRLRGGTGHREGDTTP